MNAFDYFFEYSKSLSRSFVLGPSEEISFTRLFRDSLKIANYLKGEIGENNEILLISSNSIYFIQVYLGVIKSGNICIPINPAIEQANAEHIINTTGCKILFASDEVKQVSENFEGKIIRESDLDEILLAEDFMSDILDDFDEERIAVILFTSGSTNTPKGVMLSHLNITSNTNSIIEYLKLSETDILEVVLPFYYCYGLSLLHTHLKVGGSIVLVNNFIFLGSVLENLRKFKCTGFAGVPSHFQILLRKSTTFFETQFPDLKYVTQAGGKLHDVFINEFRDAFPNINFFVMYGQTEATARLAYLHPKFLGEKLGSVGKGIPGVRLDIFDDRNFPVEVGEIGELVAKGKNIMKGYYEDPDSTKEVLKDGWLFTGDLAKKDQDGFIYLVGRKKEIIKVGGRRVSPKEIEEVILSVREVIDCTVEGIYDELLGEGIKASVIIKEGCERANLKEEILEVCYKNLSKFKIPQLICFENNLNLNSAGKKVKIAVSPKSQNYGTI